MITIEFETGSAAFDNDQTAEVCDILDRIKTKIMTTPATQGQIFDTNGNNVGQWIWSQD